MTVSCASASGVTHQVDATYVTPVTIVMPWLFYALLKEHGTRFTVTVHIKTVHVTPIMDESRCSLVLWRSILLVLSPRSNLQLSVPLVHH